MAVFTDTDELHRVMTDLWTAIKNEKEMAAQLENLEPTQPAAAAAPANAK